MGFFMDGLEAEAYDRSYSDRELVRRIGHYFRPHACIMSTVAVMIVLASIVETAIPFLIARGIDLLVADQRTTTLIGLSVGVLLLGSLGWAFNWVRQRLSARAVGDVVLQIREDAFNAVTNRDLSFYDQFSSGKIVSRVTSDTQDFATVVTLTMDLISQVSLVVLVVAVLLFVNVQLTLLSLIIAPLVVAAALAFRAIARRMIQRSQRSTANVNGLIQESVSGVAVAKSFRQEDAIYEDFGRINQQAYHVNLRTGWTFNTIFPVLDIIAGLGTAVVAYYGGLRALDGTVSVGEWYLFLQALNIFYFPLTSIASFWSQFQQGLSASERVFALVDAEPRVVQTAHEPVAQLRGEIAFEHVSFSYADQRSITNDQAAMSDNDGRVEAHDVTPVEPALSAGTQRVPASLVLNNFNLHIAAGETVAVVGHTGAGKSSLARLVARFYEFQGGRILLDGHDIRTFDLLSYRRQIGIVPQVPFLFGGTVADNIRYGRSSASNVDVARAAHQIGGGEWVELLEHGLETNVGERGASLSMGQRQLVALARVLLHDPAILILDEATASVDPFTELQIQEGLDRVMHGRTSIVIAHRLSTVRTADRIIVLRSGEIIEQGDHAALLRQGGHYAELYNTYFRHQSLSYIEQVGQIAAWPNN